ncbi:uncharacterized protein LOC119462826 isoform X4 [Dermacentor silvarum]|uniref:uncharacterized protein LOC119462826 isoform X4 n=1 Tax=Dermacentor silvarum TaxID=543639 RepID=UPI00210185D3|nr:uncharacterized protein LOC119462826 isoform X4 [Dermacentor silvarum]
MGRHGHTVSCLILLALCLGLTVGSFLYCDPPNFAKGKHAVKKMRVSGAMTTLMKKYGSCLKSHSARMLFRKYGFGYNLTACESDLNHDEICNNPDRVAEYYDCVFKQHTLIFHNVNATAEERVKMKTFWKCMKDAFKGFQDTIMRKR